MAGLRMKGVVIGKSPQRDNSTLITLQMNNSVLGSVVQLVGLNSTAAAFFAVGNTVQLYVYPTTDVAAVEAASAATKMHPND